MSWWQVAAAAVSSALGSRESRRNAEMSFDDNRRLTNLESNQERETLLYKAVLDEEARQNRRRERVRGGKNYAQFATMPQGYANKAPIDGTAKPLPVAPRIDL